MNTELNSNIWTPHSIRTYTGKVFDLENLTPEMICIEDIAQGLSQVVRFGGQLKDFYTVAQHSIMISFMVPEEDALAALLHDASEAYLGDMPSPFKSLMPDFKKYENKIMQAVADKFCFKLPLGPSIKIADRELLIEEWQNFISFEMKTISKLNQLQAKSLFLLRFRELSNTK